MGKYNTSLKALAKAKDSGKKDSGISRRRFIYGLTGVGAGVIVGGLSYKDDIVTFARAEVFDNPSFEDARRNEKYRQKFLDNLVEGTVIPHCDGVVYDGTGEKITSFYENEVISLGKKVEDINHILGQSLYSLSNGAYSLATPDILDLSGLERSTKIFVGRSTFDTLLFKNGEEVKASIVAHEGSHALQHAKWLKYLPKEEVLKGIEEKTLSTSALYDICEYDATARELQRLLKKEFNVDDEFIERRKRAFFDQSLRLSLASRNAPLLQVKFIGDAHMAIVEKYPELFNLSVSSPTNQNSKQRFK